MARVPVVESPCPIAGKALPPGATEHCTLCDRSVHNLDLMNSRQRTEFMSSCSGKVCVAYIVRVPVSSLRRRGLVAAIAAAALVSLPVAAEEPLVQGMSPVGNPNQLPNCDDYEDMVITGGVHRGDQAEWKDDGRDAPPDLPVIEDDGR
ncbi:MAG: hypothetical protein ABI769_09985 [Pseudomonadota bacterium]